MSNRTEYQQPSTLTIRLENGKTFTIRKGDVWQVYDGETETQVCLSDCDDAELNGLTICRDFSQGGVRPNGVVGRVKTIILDADLIASHVENYLA